LLNQEDDVRPLLSFIAILALLSGAPLNADACTTFLLEGESGLRVAKSYDWNMGRGLVLHNKAGMRKRSLALKPSDVSFDWTSRHASVTFNQYGRGMPNGGMNDAGLVIEIMWLKSARYPAPDARPSANELQWIQHQLDTRSSVAELLEHAGELRVSGIHGRVHYLACDASGACAALEYLDGELHVASGDALPVSVLTNHTYAKSLKHHGATRGPTKGTRSLARFVNAAHGVARRAGTPDPTSEAFEVLESVRQGDYTKWQIVYDPHAQRVAFRTTGNPAIKTLDVAGLSRECSEAVVYVDMDEPVGGDVGHRWAPWTPAINRELLMETLAPLAQVLPPGLSTAITAWALEQRCAPSGRP
jgi:choloylglycine hydrolase